MANQSITTDVIIDATILIERPSTWITGAEHKKNAKGEDCYCMIGAIKAAAKKRGVSPDPAIKAVTAVLPVNSIPSYNDQSGRSHGQVLNAMLLAADKAA